MYGSGFVVGVGLVVVGFLNVENGPVRWYLIVFGALFGAFGLVCAIFYK